MNFMDLLTVIGLVFAFSMFIFSFLLEAAHGDIGHIDFGTITSLLQITAFLIVVGGTVGATLVSFPMSEIKKMGKAVKLALFNSPPDQLALIDRLAELGDKARRSGILSLEEEIPKQDNALIKKGLELIMSGLDKELVEETLSRQAEITESELHSCAAGWEAAGGYCPTMGIIGTVMGLISLLKGLATATMDVLGNAIAVAFVATLYGVCFANVIYLPIANKVKVIAKKEAATAELIIEGILSIQAGENPKVMKDKLSYDLIAELQGIDPSAREASKKAQKSSAAE
jgi:chemotaxis protein MotA